jgi:hypothetical protein
MYRRDVLKVGLGTLLASGHALAQDAPPTRRSDQVQPRAAPPGEPAGNPLLRYRFGVNYVNSRDWHLFWSGFDADQVARDLDSIAALEMDHFRVFLLWPYFQPWYNWVDPVYLCGGWTSSWNWPSSAGWTCAPPC